MRHRANRLLDVLACAPVAAALAASIALPEHALAAPERPSPYVVAIDAGHGGRPDNSHPDQPFDPGVIAVNGAQEKDLTLSVAQRVQRLLQADLVDVAMTRKDDRYVGIEARMQTAVNAGAKLFVSIHFNSFTDPGTGGSLVLYPNDASAPFAQVVGDAVGRGLQAYAIAADGTQAKPELWQHATMPAVTVEGAYLTNPREAQLSIRDDFQEALARSVVAGIEAQDPLINRRKQQIQAWNVDHPSEPIAFVAPSHSAAVRHSVAAAPTPSGDHRAFFTLLTLLAVAAVAFPRRRRIVAVARSGGARAAPALSTLITLLVDRFMPSHSHRRRTARRRELLERARRPAYRRSVYDELWF